MKYEVTVAVTGWIRVGTVEADHETGAIILGQELDRPSLHVVNLAGDLEFKSTQGWPGPVKVDLRTTPGLWRQPRRQRRSQEVKP